MKVQRNQVWLANLGSNYGSEQGGVRPVLIVSNNKGNISAPTITIVPLTSKLSKNKLPTHVMITNVSYLPSTSIALVEQLRTIDKSRLMKFVGEIQDYNIISRMARAIKIQMDIDITYLGRCS